MTFDEFQKMWEEDGTKLHLQKDVPNNGHIWKLIAVYFPGSTAEYGRHMAMILKVDGTTGEILMHDLKNITGENPINWRATIDSWFESHVGNY